MKIFDLLKCTLHNTSQLYLTVLHKYMNCNVKWNCEEIKIDEIKISVIFECVWNSR
jgi:hypothetical protein